MNPLDPSFFIRSSSFLLVTRTCIKAWMSLNFGQISPPTLALSAHACLKKMMYNVVNTLAPTFSIGSSSFFQVTRTTFKSGQSSNLRQIGPRAAELAALDRIEKFP